MLCFPITQNPVCKAPKARNMIARGKREARRPWLVSTKRRRALKRAKYARDYFSLSGLERALKLLSRGDALRACPWLSYFAPLALQSRAVGPAITRRWRSRRWRLARFVCERDSRFFFHDQGTHEAIGLAAAWNLNRHRKNARDTTLQVGHVL